MKRLLLCTLLLLASSPARAQTAWLLSLRDTLDRLQDAGARRRLLEEVARQHPAEAWPHVALALAYAGEAPSDNPRGLRRDPGDHGWKELQRALAVDSTSSPAALVMALQALGGDDATRLDAAARTLHRAGAPGASPALALALAEVDIRLGDYVAATAAAQAAVGDSAQSAAARRLLGIGLMRMPGSADDGASTYLAGAARPGPAAPAYYRDAAVIASPAERDAWRSAADDNARAAWILAFWSRRAAAAGVSVTDRLLEHFHRVAVADRLYRVRWASPAGPAAEVDVDARDDVAYDDRGLVYLRYGAADRVENRPDFTTWLYWRPGDRTLRFFFRNSRFAESMSLAGNSAPGPRDALSSATPYDYAIELLQDVGAGDAEMTQLGTRLLQARQALQVPRAVPTCGRRNCPVSSPIETPDSAAIASASRQLRAYEAELSLVLRNRMSSALAGEDATPTVDRALPFFFDLATFRGHDGMTDVVASLAIPGDLLPSFAYPDGRELYAPHVQLAFAAGVGGARFADSAFERMAPRRLVPGEFLRVTLPLSLPPAALASYRVSVRALADSVVGQVYGGVMPLRDYTGPGLNMSDIVLAAAEGSGTWHRGAVAPAVMPALHFPAHGVVKLFYEIYNLPPHGPFHTEITLERARGAMSEHVQGLPEDDRGRSLAWDGVAQPDEGGTQQEVHLLQTDLKPGRYRIVITVTSPSTGEDVRRERQFDLMP